MAERLEGTTQRKKPDENRWNSRIYRLENLTRNFAVLEAVLWSP